jgi:hypothetical protein
VHAFGPLCFPEDVNYVVLFREMVSIK